MRDTRPPGALAPEEIEQLRKAHANCRMTTNANFRHVTIHRLLATLTVHPVPDSGVPMSDTRPPEALDAEGV